MTERLIEFSMRHWDLWLALVVVSYFLVRNLFGARLAGYSEVGPQQASALMAHEDALLLDVREENEYRQGHITDALHIPLSRLKERMGELDPHRQRPILAYCRSGHRSAHACSMLRKQQYEKVYNLGGGITAWQNANLPVSRKKK